MKGNTGQRSSATVTGLSSANGTVFAYSAGRRQGVEDRTRPPHMSEFVHSSRCPGTGTPLARLAADAQRIAGGELDVTPVESRTREVAEVGAALHGMADWLRGALAERESAEQQRRFLVSAIAHDLRTPLFTLRGSLEAIEHGIGDADQLRRAQDKATLLDRLVGDLFTFSRLEYAGPDLDREVLDVAQVAREAADTVDCRIVVVADDGVVLEGDHAVLVRVLVNLLDNAVRHARSRVELHVHASDSEVHLEVLDDGPASSPPISRSSSSRSSGRTAPATARPAAPAWAWRSSAASPPPSAGRSRPRTASRAERGSSCGTSRRAGSPRRPPRRSPEPRRDDDYVGSCLRACTEKPSYRRFG
jgi:hypothetical protein